MSWPSVPASNFKKITHKDLLYHWTEIIKAYTKLKEWYISVLCIKIGPNPFKANLNVFVWKKQYYKEIYILFVEKRK